MSVTDAPAAAAVLGEATVLQKEPLIRDEGVLVAGEGSMTAEMLPGRVGLRARLLLMLPPPNPIPSPPPPTVAIPTPRLSPKLNPSPAIDDGLLPVNENAPLLLRLPSQLLCLKLCKSG